MHSAAYNLPGPGDFQPSVTQEESDAVYARRKERLSELPRLVMESLGELPDSFAQLVLDNDAIAVMEQIQEVRRDYTDWLIRDRMRRFHCDDMTAVDQLLETYKCRT